VNNKDLEVSYTASKFNTQYNNQTMQYRVMLTIFRGPQRIVVTFAPKQIRELVSRMDDLEAKGYRPVESLPIGERKSG
jgi:hypothetical protein